MENKKEYGESMRENLLYGLELLKKTTPFLLAVIIEKHGSAPRGVGASMILTKDGLARGTIGGGAVEYEAIQYGTELLKEKRHGEKFYVLTDAEAENIGMICGGNNRIAFTYFDPKDLPLLKELLTSDVKGLALPLVYGEERKAPIDTDVLEKTPRRDEIREIDGREYFICRLVTEPRAIIFGGGHVSRALARTLVPLEFKVHIAEDRKDFLKPEDFVGVDGLHFTDFNHIEKTVSIQKEDYVCIMTRGHAADKEVTAQVLEKEPKYLGVIGSNRKVLRMKKELEERGFTREQLDSLYSPIGLDIGAETPEEIAVSVAGEMIRVLRTGR